MALLTEEKTTLKEWLKLQDLITSGEGARICGFIDGRTFLKWADRFGVKPVARWGSKALYKKVDAEKVSRLHKELQARKGEL